jgi:hypothetical protein
MENYNIPIPGYNPLRFTPQMPYAQLPGLANMRGGYNIQAPNYIDPNQNQGAQYQTKPQWQFGINYNHLAFSNAVQGVGAFLRSNNQRNDFRQYNRAQQNPLSQIPENPNNTQQALYGDKLYRMGGKIRYEDGGPTDPKDVTNIRNFYKDYLNSPNYLKRLQAQGHDDPQSLIKDRLNQLDKTQVIERQHDNSQFTDSTYDKNKDGTWKGKYQPTVYYNPDQGSFDGTDREHTLAHEFGHSVSGNDGRIGLNKKESDLLYNKNQYNNTVWPASLTAKDRMLRWHDKDPDELKADIDSFRYQLKKDGTYDTGTQDFNQKLLDNAKKKYGNTPDFKNLFERLNDKDFIYIMNNIASNDNQTPNQAKRGGQVRFAEGGQGPGKPIPVTNPPIYTNNQNDPRLKAYTDSLNLHNMGEEAVGVLKNPSTNTNKWYDYRTPESKKENVYLNDLSKMGKSNDWTDIYKRQIESGVFTFATSWDSPKQPYIYRPNDPKRSNLQGPIQIPNNRSQINQPTGGPEPLAGGPTNFSFTGRDDQGQQDTRYFSDLDSWKAATDKMGYSNREITNNGKQANATGYQFAEGGQFDNFDDFDEDDFQDLKEELDNYFKDRDSKPIENLTENKGEEQPEQQDQPEQEDTYKPTGAMDFLNQQQPEYEAQDQSDKDILDQLSGQQSIPQPEPQQSQDNHPSIEAFKNGISRVENAGYNEGNKNSTAFGKYQFTAPTREGVRQQFFPNINKKDFEDAYKSDPKFQEKVMDVYGNHLLNTYGGDPHKAATAFFLGPGKANMYNQPNYNPGHGNVSVGQYLKTFDRGYGMKGGGYVTSPGSVSTGFDIPYNFKMEEGGQGPGDGKKPTTADSLALYNNAKQVEDYYINQKYNKHNEKQVSFPAGFMTQWNDINATNFAKGNNTLTETGNRRVPISEYRKDINQNQYYQREMADAVLDTRAPMGMYDKRIDPQIVAQYDATRNTPNENLKDDAVEIYKYDPIAIKPWNMLTDDERKQRISKYGDPTRNLNKPTDLINRTTKPVFIPPPMNRSQVQSPGSLRSPYGPIQSPPMTMGPLAGQNQTPYSFTGRDDNGQQTTRYFNDLDTWRQATDRMGYSNREVTGDNKSAQATGYQFREGGEYSLTKLQAAQLKKLGYEIEEI